ncbi:IS200/IS605 family element transposase accessory protein TnpB [Gracilibacillus salitolerans]|uniref:IS200/IS605 family element transposase accessory protein TnpB n=1 Tax=Gracilibacillus salitolerans TaxID=2663022 RepID=A0A5Q2TMI3_9BACI|nr:RNA-guided endonuclease TnpB family protein [Gracilibacillus salitolerans]QGH36164.1 IS200/IS605 family element transposase accessory protein TnpB [Gracilibacillus salitolerans]
MYRTQQIRIKKGHRLYHYCDHITFLAKNLYNATNFHIRQIFTAFGEEKNLQPLQQEVFDLIEQHLPQMNAIKRRTVEKKRELELKKPMDQRKEIKDAMLFEYPSSQHKWPSYAFLDGLFKVSENEDYLALPGQVNQQVMKMVFQNWKSYFASLKDYQVNPHKYTGRPKLPKYAPKNGRKACLFSNQVCKVKDDKYLQFPHTKERVNFGKLGLKGQLQQVRIIPTYGEYTVEVVIMKEEEKKLVELDEKHVMGIDLGVHCLATIVDNTGSSPVIMKGQTVKSINQYYNKQRAHYYRVLRHGQGPKDGSFHSKRLQRLDQKRYFKLKDAFHKASYHIVQLALARKVSTIVIGVNKGWKNKVKLRKQDKQHFQSLPHTMLIRMVEYKAEPYGINVQRQEESYTSKASLVDMDELPIYEKGVPTNVVFSGRRIKRGLYRTKENTCIHADVNAAGNIIRKVVPNAFADGIEGVVSRPLMLSIV